MLSLTLDMVQYDCPFIDTSEGHDVSFSGAQWDFDTARKRFETHVVVVGDDREAVDNGLDALRSHSNIDGFQLLSRRGDTAVIRTATVETAAMRAIRGHHGYLTGSFEAHNGHELWRVGFDSDEQADYALSELQCHNEFAVLSREHVAPDDLADLLENAGAATALLDACRDLTETERRTLEVALGAGYFESPRGASLGDLATEFGVSKTAVSHNLRRAEGKVLSRLVEALTRLDTE